MARVGRPLQLFVAFLVSRQISSACRDGVTLSFPPTGLQQTISYPSNGRKYGNNLNCTWNFSPPVGYRILVEIIKVDTERCCDYLRIYNGASMIAKLSGMISTLQRYITRAGSRLQFTSDSSVNRTGFIVRMASFPPLPRISRNWLYQSQAGVDYLNVTIRSNSQYAKLHRLQYRPGSNTVWKNASGFGHVVTIDTTFFRVNDLSPSVQYELRPIPFNSAGEEGESGVIRYIRTTYLRFDAEWFVSHRAEYMEIEVTMEKSVELATSYRFENSAPNVIFSCGSGLRAPECPSSEQTSFNSSHAKFTSKSLVPGRSYSFRPVPYYNDKRGTPAHSELLKTKSIDELHCFDVTENSTNVWILVNSSHSQRILKWRQVNGEWNIFEGFYKNSIQEYIIYFVTELDPGTEYEFRYHYLLNMQNQTSRIAEVKTLGVKDSDTHVLHDWKMNSLNLYLLIGVGILFVSLCIVVALTIVCVRRRKRKKKEVTGIELNEPANAETVCRDEPRRSAREPRATELKRGIIIPPPPSQMHRFSRKETVGTGLDKSAASFAVSAGNAAQQNRANAARATSKPKQISKRTRSTRTNQDNDQYEKLRR